MHAEPGHGLTGSTSEDSVLEALIPDQRPKHNCGLWPQRTYPPLVALAEDAHGRRSAELQVAGAQGCRFIGTRTAVVKEEHERVVARTKYSLLVRHS
jgi:hypothetical protein